MRRAFLLELAKRATDAEPKLMSSLGWLEIVPENFMSRGGAVRHALMELSEVFPVALHGVSLSIGSSDPLNEDYLTQLRQLARDLRAPWATDHLSLSSANGIEFHQLIPLPMNRDMVKYLVKRIREVQAFLGIPFGLENPSYYISVPGSEMTEAQFISEVVEGADCHLLLDLNNVFVNSLNQQAEGIDRVDLALERSKHFLSQLPLDRVMEVHVAGHARSVSGNQDFILDTHGSNVCGSVRQLVRELSQLISIDNLLLEREQNIPPLDQILDEVNVVWDLTWN